MPEPVHARVWRSLIEAGREAVTQTEPWVQGHLGIDAEALWRDLGYKPHAGQRVVHDSKAPRRVLACGARFGKSTCAAMEGVRAMLAQRRRSYGWICAPNYDLADKVFREIRHVVLERLPARVVRQREHEIVLRNVGGEESTARAKSADNPTSLLGEGLDWLIVDEAARLRPDIWDAHLSQRLIDKKGWALLISTPKGKGWFYDLWRRGNVTTQATFRSWNLPSWENPHLDREAIEAERSRLPERVFAQEYEAKFVEGAGQVFRNVRDCATGELLDPEPETSYVAGLDLAKTEDYTVLVILRRTDSRVVYVDRFHRIDWEQQVARIKAATERYGECRVLVDSTGKGEPVYESLRRAGIAARDYTFTQRSKAALVDNLALLLERQALMLPRPEFCPELIDELEAFEFSSTPSGKLTSSAPPGMHDDCAIALALAVWWVRKGGERVPIAGIVG